MSSPDAARDVAPNERKLTIIVVPHGDLETRNFVISYGRLKVIVVSVLVLLLIFAVGLATLIPIMTQAARVPGLVQELQTLQGERAKVAELGQALLQMEEQYNRVREMLGADAVMPGDSAPILPPLRRDSGNDAPDEEAQTASLVDLWPLDAPGYITRALSNGDSRHSGIDIAVQKNSYTSAARAGGLHATGLDEVHGRFVVLDHGETLEPVYGHAASVFVAAGERVRRSEIPPASESGAARSSDSPARRVGRRRRTFISW